MSEVIVVTSGKGGVGKTTTTANIGYALAKHGFEVLLIDTDIGLRNLDVVMGLENRIVYNLVDVVEGNCRYQQAIIRDKQCDRLSLLPAAQTRDKTAVSPEQMIKLVSQLKPEYDYIIIDCPAGIEQGFKNAIAAAKRAIVVTTPEVSAIRDADRIIGILNANEIPRIDLVINRIRPDMVKRGEMMSEEDVVEILGVNHIGSEISIRIWSTIIIVVNHQPAYCSFICPEYLKVPALLIGCREIGHVFFPCRLRRARQGTDCIFIRVCAILLKALRQRRIIFL